MHRDVFWLKNYLFRHNAYAAYKEAIRFDVLPGICKKEIEFNRLKDLVEYAYQHVPFYRNYYEEKGGATNMLKSLADTQYIPVVEKNDIRSNLSEFLSEEYSFEMLTLSTTGGTTGLPLKLYKNPSTAVEVMGWRAFGWWVSEPDKGQSDAFNKGFCHSRGKFLTWLNADDVYFPGALAAVKEKLLSHPEAKWATGNFVRFRDSDKRIIEAKWGPHILPKGLQTFDSPFAVYGPTTFWSREVYKTVGNLDENLHYSMDTDYWLRIMKAGFLQVRVNKDIGGFRMHEESKTAVYDEHVADEKTLAAKENERRYKKDKLHYNPKLSKKISLYMIRALDGSAFIALYRNLFVIGSKLSL